MQTEEAARSYEEVIEQGVANAMRAFRPLLDGSEMFTYLAMMEH
jgi:hypothetical protein